MSDRCHTYQGFHIPGCMGCAVYGHRQCTCPRSRSDPDDTDELAQLRRRVEDLERRLVVIEQRGE